MLGNWDSYQYDVLNNYRLYHDPSTGLWSLLQLGIDATFDIPPADASIWPIWSPTAVLARRCLEEQDCRDAFAARLAEAIEVFESLDLATQAETMHEQLLPLIEADTRREYTMQANERAQRSLLAFIAGWPDAMRASLAAEGY